MTPDPYGNSRTERSNLLLLARLTLTQPVIEWLGVDGTSRPRLIVQKQRHCSAVNRGVNQTDDVACCCCVRTNQNERRR